jgi:molybdate transport system regulatory protein
MATPALKVRLRIINGEQDAFGPGKAQLLESLLTTGSLNRTAADMRMSYVKALALARTMNSQFSKPLVELARGGRHGGGTQVTALGKKVLAEYQAMSNATEKAAGPSWRRLRRLLRA